MPFTYTLPIPTPTLPKKPSQPRNTRVTAVRLATVLTPENAISVIFSARNSTVENVEVEWQNYLTICLTTARWRETVFAVAGNRVPKIMRSANVWQVAAIPAPNIYLDKVIRVCGSLRARGNTDLLEPWGHGESTRFD